jgi:hypothetical protein
VRFLRRRGVAAWSELGTSHLHRGDVAGRLAQGVQCRGLVGPFLAGQKTALFLPTVCIAFYMSCTKDDRFTKTGSGQTYRRERTQQKRGCFLAADCRGRRLPHPRYLRRTERPLDRGAAGENLRGSAVVRRAGHKLQADDARRLRSGEPHAGRQVRTRTFLRCRFIIIIHYDILLLRCRFIPNILVLPRQAQANPRLMTQKEILFSHLYI